MCDNNVPYGFCQCGCGGKAPIAHMTDNKRGYRKGQPRSYIRGHNTPKQDLSERFWSKVDKSEGPEACWPWTAATYGNGYGHFALSKTVGALAHRIAYKLEYGTVSKGILICHTCDNVKCVNPSHLFPGSHKDNMSDMTRKGRRVSVIRRGEDGPNAKLTWKIVREIRVSKESIGDLSKRYNTSLSNVKSILKCKTWKE